MLIGTEQQFIEASGMCQLFVDRGYLCWLDFGCLLGLVRDGKPIGWDDDIDLAILNIDIENFRKIIQEYFLEYSYRNDISEFDLVGSENKTIIKLLDSTSRFSVFVDHDSKKYFTFDGTLHEDIISQPWITFFIINNYGDDFLINDIEPWYFYNKDIVFPLKLEYLLENRFWIPNQERKFISLCYGDWYIAQKLDNQQKVMKRFNVIQQNKDEKILWEEIRNERLAKGL